MKNKLKAIVVLFLTGVAASMLAAGPATCYAIKDPAFRSQCLAEAQRSPVPCYNIKDHDQKNYCLAIAHDTKAYCYQIKDADKKSYCLSK